MHTNNLRLRYGFVPYNSTVNVGKLVYAKNPDYIRSSAPYQSRTLTTGWFGTYATYGKVMLDTSVFKTGALVNTPGTLPTTKSRWAGCIEERQTDNVTIDGGNATTAPAAAWDLDVNMIPNSDASRWAPWWPQTVFDPNPQPHQYTDAKYCASPASRLKEYYDDKASFMDYVDGLKPLGGTYHDIGVIWGARFISPDGIFASATPVTNNQNDPDNPTKLRGFTVRKYMIFMTDGILSPNLADYTTYGVEERDKRVLGNSTGDLAAEQLQRHLQRFRMACNAAKSQGIQLYVIAFSTTLTADMENCATTKAMASGITTAPALIAKFQEIGSKIGSLRINQ